MLEFNEGAGDQRTLFVDVILPLSISKTYTYRVPKVLDEVVEVGKRVIVQFGKSRIYTAIVIHISGNPPLYYEQTNYQYGSYLWINCSYIGRLWGSRLKRNFIYYRVGFIENGCELSILSCFSHAIHSFQQQNFW